MNDDLSLHDSKSSIIDKESLRTAFFMLRSGSDKSVFLIEDYRHFDVVKFLIDNFDHSISINISDGTLNLKPIEKRVEDILTFNQYNKIYEKFYSKEVQSLIEHNMPSVWIWSLFFDDMVCEMLEEDVELLSYIFNKIFEKYSIQEETVVSRWYNAFPLAESLIDISIDIDDLKNFLDQLSDIN